MNTHPITCKNCGNQFTGNYCNNCGEKVYHEHDKSIGHLFEETFHFITHFDNKFFRTIRVMVTRPGMVSKDFCNGIRQKYFKPISLFLIGVVIYLLFPVLRGLNIKFQDHIGQYNLMHLFFMEKWAAHKAAGLHVSMDQFAILFEKKSEKISKLLLLILIPLSAFLLNALFAKRKKTYFDHFILAAEINTFYLYFTFLFIPLLMFIVSLFTSLLGIHFSYGDSAWMILLLTLPVIIFAFSAIKRFYEVKRFSAAFKSFLFLAGHTLIVYFLYRIILFSLLMLLL